MAVPDSGRGTRFSIRASAATLVVGGVLIMVAAKQSPQVEPPADPPAASAVGGAGAGAAVPIRSTAPLRRAAPVHLEIPSIGVKARIISLGLNQDGTVAVPPLSKPELTSWYKGGSAPGERGPAALFGHVDSAERGPAVFYHLDRLKRGDQVLVTRKDGNVAVFKVDSVERFAKDHFPTERVYGSTRKPTLRLVTCGGDFDKKRREYRDNVVVFATYEGRGEAPQLSGPASPPA